MHLVILLIILIYKNKCILNAFKFNKSAARILVSRCILNMPNYMYLKCPSDVFIPIVFTIYFTFKN